METQHTLSITASPTSPVLSSPLSTVTSDPADESVITPDLNNLVNRPISPALDVTTP